MALTSKVLKGSSWIFGLQVVQRVMRTSRAFILARLLAPEDFGLFGIASLMLLGFEVFTRTGIDDAIIHTHDDIESYLHTSYWIQVTRGFALAAIIFISAPYVAAFFDNSGVISVCRLLALVVIFRGIKSVGIVILQRELDFKNEAIYLFWASLIEFISTLLLAYSIKNVWALIIGFLIGEFTLTVLSFVFHPYRPKLLFDFEKSKKMTRFGRWILLSGVVSYISLQLDNILVGRWISLEALGIYQMAYFLANLPATEITKVISKVLDPAYAKLQNDKERLLSAFRKSFTVTTALVLPSAVGLIIAAPIVVTILLGKNWNEAIPLVSILSLGGLFRGFGAVGGSLFKALGVPHLIFKIELIRSITLGISIYPAFLVGGSIGIAWASVASTVVMFLATFWSIFRIIGQPRILLQPSLYIAAATYGMGSVLFFATRFVAPGWIEWIFVALISAFVYFSILVLLFRNEKFLYLGLKSKKNNDGK